MTVLTQLVMMNDVALLTKYWLRLILLFEQLLQDEVRE